MVRHHRERHCGFTLIEVIVAGLILAVGMTALLTLTSRALAMQRRGEQKIVAASILDELLGSILTEGPQDFVRLHSTNGPCEPPFEDWNYKVEIEDAVGIDPFRLMAEVTSPDETVYQCATLIAPKLGEVPDPDRFPPEPIDREARWAEIEDEEQQ
jgi:prepilin-type N-terminal cleavage/methylation domain-containing protein